MYFIDLNVDLYIKKIDIMDEKDVQLIKELDKDELVRKYLYPVEFNFYNGKYSDRKYLYTEKIYDAPYSIYLGQMPIGYLEISDIFEMGKMVVISLALLKIARGYGYATKILDEITKIIFSDVLYDVEKIVLVIDYNNKKSQHVAERTGFISDGLSQIEHEEAGFVKYVKIKKFYDR